ncbi:MFS transporter [Anianabacter salinae]|uniref:MFS transporter n=1 Tax=Anianabacter salinae TaxID=2851023 RepID=UPI00225E5471|nr:MFS transporter [Anianabacter salinae]MBV0910848.1 MFS transporter [Anianabacter salinae]
MLSVLSHRNFARLFGAQVIALMGTGLLTIALGLVAYDLAGADAGRVLGLALTIKMLAYVGLSPVAAAVVARLDRRRVLVGADLVRAGAALCLPFVTEEWQIYALIFVLQAASATFTPTFQAVIPDILPDEADYTRALSLSRLAYDLENVLSPALAGLLLTVIASNGLFAGTGIGFLVSAALVAGAAVPTPRGIAPRPFRDRLTRGTRIFIATPRLRGLLALNVAVAFSGAVVIVLSVVIARSVYGGGEGDLAWAMGAYGLGSMLVALGLPMVLDRAGERPVMLLAGLLAGGGMAGTGAVILLTGWPGWGAFLALWCVMGAAASGIMTPSGRLLRRSAHAEDRPAVFAAQFALSHACWLVAYPAAGLIGSAGGPAAAMLALGAAALGGVAYAALLWPAGLPDAVAHTHDDLPPDHPHLRGAERRGGAYWHRHVFVIDDEHHAWPTQG